MNNPLVKVVAVVVVLVGVGWLAFSKYKSKVNEYDHRLDLARIKMEFVERLAATRIITDPARYKDEIRAQLKWYFVELTEHYNRFLDFKDYERFLDELDEKKRSKKMKDAEFAQYEERYKATKAFWDLATGAKYDPLFTDVQQGVRFDIYDVQAVPDPKEPKFRLSFALWGAQRKWSVDTSGGRRELRLTVNAIFREVVFSGLDSEGKEIRKMAAQGEPNKIEHPERFIDEFYPDLVIGYYELPKVPAEVATAELVFDLGTRSVISGEEYGGKFTWKTAVPTEWKLPPGASWEGATEQERPAEPEQAKPKDAKEGKKKKGKR